MKTIEGETILLLYNKEDNIFLNGTNINYTTEEIDNLKDNGYEVYILKGEECGKLASGTNIFDIVEKIYTIPRYNYDISYLYKIIPNLIKSYDSYYETLYSISNKIEEKVSSRDISFSHGDRINTELLDMELFFKIVKGDSFLEGLFG